VLCNGAPVLLPWADRPAAIVEAYLGGQAAGSAITDVLVGDAGPAGRLAESFPASPLIPAAENFRDRGRQVQYREGLYVGYRFHETAQVQPRFCFGHGLSYTTFDWSDPDVGGENADLIVEVTITNSGARSGSEVVQLYVHDTESSVYRPTMELRQFDKVHLEPGESTRVRMPLDERAFAIYDVDEQRWRVEAGTFELRLAASSRDVRFRLSVDVPGEVIDPRPRGADGPTTQRLVASDIDFEEMLGREIPPVTSVLPFTINTVIAELSATRLGSAAQSAFLRIADRQASRLLGSDPDPVLAKLSHRMIREAPLRFLVSMSGGSGSIKMFDGLAKLLSALRITGRRSRRSSVST
jgi:beta-glucosidase